MNFWIATALCRLAMTNGGLQIPGSISFPWRTINNESAASRLDPKVLHVTYCDGIGCNASTKWLGQMGISRQLVNTYKKDAWITPLAHGVFAKLQETVEWQGAVHALQFQLGLNVHVGGRAALVFQGLAHTMPMGRATIDLLIAPGTQIPRWFIDHVWKDHIRIIQNNALDPTIEIQAITITTPYNDSAPGFNILISSRERAALELLHLAPRLYIFDEVRVLMESLGTLMPEVLTKLLSVCRSEKVKRLLLYFGDKKNHAWRSKIDENQFKTGETLLEIVDKNGHYDAKYRLFVPNDYMVRDDNLMKLKQKLDYSSAITELDSHVT